MRGKIAVEDNCSIALPESAIAKDGDKFFAFTTEEEGDAWSLNLCRGVQGSLKEAAEEFEIIPQQVYSLKNK